MIGLLARDCSADRPTEVAYYRALREAAAERDAYLEGGADVAR
jgi:hypothetical protein